MRKRLLLVSIPVLLYILCAGATLAQSVKGDWYSLMNVQGFELRLTLHVAESQQGMTSTLDSPDQEAFGIPSTSTTFSFPVFSFESSTAGYNFSGQVSDDYKSISGIFEQGGMKTTLVFTRNPGQGKSSIQSLKEHYNKQEVYISMHDGVRLFTSIYTPKNTSVKHPILLNRTPYDIEPDGPGKFNIMMQLYKRYTDEEYIMVFQDVRGKFMSEGEFEDIRPVVSVQMTKKGVDEATDTWETVDWLVKNVENNNGNVGIFGISYPGFYSTMALIHAHPAVKAVSPQAPVTNWYLGDDIHHNGAFFLLDNFGFYYGFGRPKHGLTRIANPGFTWPQPDNYAFFMEMGTNQNLTRKYMGDSIKFWNEILNHPDYDDFWKARNPLPYLTNVIPAVLVVGGWFDAEDLYGTLHTYQAIEKQNPASHFNSLVMGPWSHGQWGFGTANNLGNIYWGQDANDHFMEIEKNFFNYYLKGEGQINFPEASIFITGTNKWRTFDTWPPKNTVSFQLFMTEGGKLDNNSPVIPESYDEYVSDPMKPVPYTDAVHTDRTTSYMTDDQRFASRRPDVMVYQTNILSEDMTVTGPLHADLFVSTSGTDADYIVKIIDVFPPNEISPVNLDIRVPLGGYQMLVRAEVLRGRYRNSFEKPEPFIPGQITEVAYDLPDIAHTFKKGHRMMVQVQNSWFPLVDRNPQKFVDIYHCTDTDFQKATQRIFHDASHPSHISFQVLK